MIKELTLTLDDRKVDVCPVKGISIAGKNQLTPSESRLVAELLRLAEEYRSIFQVVVDAKK